MHVHVVVSVLVSQEESFNVPEASSEPLFSHLECRPSCPLGLPGGWLSLLGAPYTLCLLCKAPSLTRTQGTKAPLLPRTLCPLVPEGRKLSSAAWSPEFPGSEQASSSIQVGSEQPGQPGRQAAASAAERKSCSEGKNTL